MTVRLWLASTIGVIMIKSAAQMNDDRNSDVVSHLSRLANEALLIFRQSNKAQLNTACLPPDKGDFIAGSIGSVKPQKGSVFWNVYGTINGLPYLIYFCIPDDGSPALISIFKCVHDLKGDYKVIMDKVCSEPININGFTYNQKLFQTPKGSEVRIHVITESLGQIVSDGFCYDTGTRELGVILLNRPVNRPDLKSEKLLVMTNTLVGSDNGIPQTRASLYVGIDIIPNLLIGVAHESRPTLH